MYSDYQNGNYGISIDAQSAISNWFGLRTDSDYMFSINGTSSENLTVGPQINLFGTIMEGLLFGIYPGITVSIGKQQVEYEPKLFGELCYDERIGKRLGIGIYIDEDFLDLANTSFGIKIGYYLCNSYYKKQ